MKVYATEHLRIDLDTENWECRRCDHVMGSAREPYKKGLKLYKRNPREIHRPILDETRYEYTFAPDPDMCAIYESYCPNCGVMVDAEYVPPGMEPCEDILFDIDALKIYWADLEENHDLGVGPRSAEAGCTHNH